MTRPTWQLPPGVSRGVWDYVHDAQIADGYDGYFAGNWLFDLDEQLVLDELARSGGRAGQCVADLGCGTGRMLAALCRHGYRGLAIDLSSHMLRIVHRKAQQAGYPIACLRANLVQLECLADQSIDHAVSLFSTWGMIRGRAARRTALRHVRRILKADGRFIVHVHNYWYNLFHAGGPAWMLRNLARRLVRRDCELGDKFYPYRGLPSMFLHVFRRREMDQDLRASGFVNVIRAVCLDPRRGGPLRYPRLAGNYRAGGWVFVCR
jgi:ubiquinone/menaquinone biosynthesis C-methylase UbiE